MVAAWTMFQSFLFNNCCSCWISSQSSLNSSSAKFKCFYGRLDAEFRLYEQRENETKYIHSITLLWEKQFWRTFFKYPSNSYFPHMKLLNNQSNGVYFDILWKNGKTGIMFPQKSARKWLLPSGVADQRVGEQSSPEFQEYGSCLGCGTLDRTSPEQEDRNPCWTAALTGIHLKADLWTGVVPKHSWNCQSKNLVFTGEQKLAGFQIKVPTLY